MSEVNEELVKRRLEQHKNFLNSLLEKKVLRLTVEVKSLEDVEQISEWMFSKEKPMTAELQSISWDDIPATPEVLEAVEILQQWASQAGTGQ